MEKATIDKRLKGFRRFLETLVFVADTFIGDCSRFFPNGVLRIEPNRPIKEK